MLSLSAARLAHL